MNRSEKLLEAIGQIDDRLILDAEKAGVASGAKNAAAGTKSVSSGSRSAAGTKRKNQKKKAAIIRYRSALAACAALVICVGVYGLLAAKGLILSPFGESESSQNAQVTEDCAMDTAEEAAVETDGTSMDVAAANADESKTAVSETAETTANADSVAQGGEDTSSQASGKNGRSGNGGTTESKQSGTGKNEDSKSEENTETVSTAAENAETTSGTEESASTESAVTESAVTEGATTESTDAETEGAETESIGQMELALAQEPMVMSLRGNEGTPAYDPDQTSEAPQLAAELVKASGTDVTLRYSNQYTDATVTYGSMYELERQTQSGWSGVDIRDDVAWVDVLYELEAGKSAKETVRLATMYGELEAGHYRLVKNCTVVAADQTEEMIVIYTEFDIVK